LGAPVAGCDEVRRDIHAQHIRVEFCGGQRRRAIAATEIQDLHARLYPEPVDERLSLVPSRSQS
jgi:hypothetical protein